jgi:hypothetical protein
MSWPVTWRFQVVGYLDTHNGNSMAIVCQSTRLLVKKENILQFEGIMTYRAERTSITKTDHLGLCREITAVSWGSDETSK